MRIVSGILRGRIIQPPKNLRARPTTDFAKENLFNVIESHRDVESADVLDLFAGTGSISYEFASRGAASVVSVEINAVHYDFIRRTARNFGLDRIHPVKANAFLYLKSSSCERISKSSSSPGLILWFCLRISAISSIALSDASSVRAERKMPCR